MSKKTDKGAEAGIPEVGTDEVSYLDILQKLRIVIRAAQRHAAWIEKQCGVRGAQLWIMQELHETPGLRVGDIARRLSIHQTTASNLLDGLGKRNYVVKTRDPKDQRATLLSLSEAGEDLLAQAPKPARGLLHESLKHLDAASLSHLEQGLQGLLDSIGTMDEGFGYQLLPFMV